MTYYKNSNCVYPSLTSLWFNGNWGWINFVPNNYLHATMPLGDIVLKERKRNFLEDKNTKGFYLRGIFFEKLMLF